MVDYKQVFKRWKRYQQVKAKTLQRDPAIVDDPKAVDIIAVIKKANSAGVAKSCRGVISEEEGLIIFDSGKYTHAQAVHVLDDTYKMNIPDKLKPEHQITFVSTPALDWKRVFVFTSQKAFTNPLDELQKYEKNWVDIKKTLKPVYVPYDKYDDVRYYLDTLKDRDELLRELRTVVDLN